MANLPYQQIGENLYAESNGKYFNINNGNRQYVQSPFDTQQEKLNAYYESQKKNQLDALFSQRNKAVTGYNQQKKDLAPVYQNQRNQADAVNMQNVTRLRELMAAQGINASGENLTTQANMMSSRLGALTDITNQENRAMGEIDRLIAEENDPSREQSIYNTVETERSRALADALAQTQSEVSAKATDWRNYQNQVKQQEEAQARWRQEQEAARLLQEEAQKRWLQEQETARKQWEWEKQMKEQAAIQEKQQFALEQQMRELEIRKMQQALAAQKAAKAKSGSKSTAKKSSTTKAAGTKPQQQLLNQYRAEQKYNPITKKPATTPTKVGNYTTTARAIF